MALTTRNAHRPAAPLRRRAVAAAIALTFSAQAVPAADWTFLPAVSLRETYTDNVTLAPQGQASADWVTEVVPSLDIRARGRRLQLDADASRQEIYYADKDRGTHFANQLNARANAELIDQLLFINGAATVGQQTISPIGPQPLDNIHLTGNRTEVRTYSVSPYLLHTFGADATGELRYGYASVAASAGDLQAAHTDTISAHLTSGTAFRTFGWSVLYDESIQHYESASTVDLRTLTTNGSYLVTPQFKFTASAGYDKNDYPTIGPATQGAFWSAGGAWSVSPRTNVSASVGHRYYGHTGSLQANTRNRLGVLSLSYDQSVTTTQSQLGLPATTDVPAYLDMLLSGSIADPAQRIQAVNAIIDSGGLPRTLAAPTNFFTNDVFLQKQLLGSAVFSSPRTTLALSLFDTHRSQLSTPLTASTTPGGNDNNQWGASAVLSRRLTTVTNANFSVVTSKITSNGGGTDNRTAAVTAGLSTLFAHKLRGSLELRHIVNSYNLPGLGYRENAITTFINIPL